MAATIDTLRLAKRFKEVKLSEEQAELLAETFREAHEAELAEVASKADLAILREELGRRIDALDAKIDAVEAKLGHRIDELEAKLERQIDALDAKIDAVEARLGRRIDDVEAKLGRRIDGLDAKIDGLEARLTIRLGGMLAAAVVLVGALVAIF
jgi:chromosome segregation ATPase